MSDVARANASAATDFPFEFAEPGDAELSWEWDDMHMPFAITPLAGDYAVHLIGAGLNESYSAFDFPARYHAAAWNGYVYYAYAPNVPEAERKAVNARFDDLCRARAEVTAAWWTNEAIPELRALYASVDGIAVDDLTGGALADAWLGAWAAMERAWRIHFIAILGPYQAVSDLADAYEKAVPGAPPGEAMRLVQGMSPDLFDVAVALDDIVAQAIRAPEVVARLASDPPPSLEELARLPGGAPTVDRIEAFLAAHGHLGQAHDDLAQPSYGEEPRLLLSDVAKRLERPAKPAAARRSELRAESERLADDVRARLADRPEELARFEHLLALGREIGHLTEGHNYWIDRMAQATLRRLAFRVGERLVREGSLAAPDDVLYLDSHEVAAAIRQPGDRHGLIGERRRAHAYWQGVRPPAKLGKEDAAEEEPSRFGLTRVGSTEPGVLRGKGASPGVVRGTARVALSNLDFPRIRPGDIIVSPSSNPSWVPVFTIAGGLVTNTGGVLSHAAVVAREFALPAVVGVADATTSIADGQTIEIDGIQGTVRLL